MDHAELKAAITEGTDVYGLDGEKVGSIVRVYPNVVVVEKGFFFQTDYYIPLTAFSGVEDSKLYLNVTKDGALNQGWDARPEGLGDDVAAGMATTTERRNAIKDDPALDVFIDRSDAIPIGTGDPIAGGVAEGGTPIAMSTVNQPARVAAREVGQDVGPAELISEEELIEVPVFGEDVIAETHVRVAEEVEITKEAVDMIVDATDTVRHEEVRVVGHVVEINPNHSAPERLEDDEDRDR